MFFTAAQPSIRRNTYVPAGRALERFLDETLNTSRQSAPRYAQDETSFSISLDVPGISKEHLSISIEGAIVRIVSREGAERQYRAAYELPQEIDAASSEAKLENGVLTLTLAKKIQTKAAAELIIH